MEWKFDNRKPIYAQIVDIILKRIVTGIYEPGSRLPSVRELAGEASVNPNTMQKALSDLEGSGLIYAVRTSGRFVTENEEAIAAAREKLMISETTVFLRNMRQMGVSREEIIDFIRKTDTLTPEEATNEAAGETARAAERNDPAERKSAGGDSPEKAEKFDNQTRLEVK